MFLCLHRSCCDRANTVFLLRRPRPLAQLSLWASSDDCSSFCSVANRRWASASFSARTREGEGQFKRRRTSAGPVWDQWKQLVAARGRYQSRRCWSWQVPFHTSGKTSPQTWHSTSWLCPRLWLQQGQKVKGQGRHQEVGWVMDRCSGRKMRTWTDGESVCWRRTESPRYAMLPLDGVIAQSNRCSATGEVAANFIF